MKKIKYLILVVLLVFIPLNVNALTATPKLSCNKSSLKSGETTTCTITISVSSGTLTSFSGKVTVSSNLQLSSVKSSSIWQGDGEGGRYELYTDTPKTGNVAIGTFVVKAKSGYNSNGTVTLGNINLGDEGYKEISKGNLSKTLKAKSTDANLKSLSVTNETISPAFNANTTKYTLKTTASKITIKATVNNSSAKVSGAGTKTVNYGTNTYTIKVTAEAGNTKSYTIIVTRPDNRSNINTLKSLSLSTGKISFSSTKTNYNVSVDSNVDSIKITSSLTDSKSTYSSGTANMTKKLNYGLNTVKIVVKAENGSTKTYTLNITRKDNRSSNNELSQIMVDEKNITLIKDKMDYQVNVSYETENVKVGWVASDTKSKVEEKYPNKLKVGENIFEIKVTAENGSTKVYKIKVVRNEEAVVLSDDSSLKSLTIVGYQIDFNKDKKEYKIKTNDKTLKVIPEVNDVNAKYEIKGDGELKDGSVISIIVTAQDGSISEYKVVVEKLVEDNNTNITNYAIFGITELIVVLGIIFVIKKIKKERNN